MTTMQQIILCTARAWIDYGRRNNWREGARGNSEAWIQHLWECYGGARNLGSAYCVPTAWDLINDALTLAGCPNPVPRSNNVLGSGHGNVYGTWYDARNVPGLVVDTTPDVGAIFVRGNVRGGFNHMGVVLGVDVDYQGQRYRLHTIEGNTSEDGTGVAEGFVERYYTQSVYDSYATVTIKPHTALPAITVRGWQFLHVERTCSPAAPRSGPSSCWGFDIVCEAPSPENPVLAPICDVSTPPAPRSDDGSWDEWLLITDLEQAERDNAAASGGIVVSQGKKGAGYRTPALDADGQPLWQVDETQCWVRFRRTATGSTRPPLTLPPIRNACIERTVTSSCRDGAIRVRYPAAGEVITLAELGDKGIRESLLAQVITRNDFMARGYSQRATEQFDRFPVIKTSKDLPIVMAVESSDLYQIMVQQTLLGPSPLVLNIPRDEAVLYQFDRPLQGPLTGAVQLPGSGGILGTSFLGNIQTTDGATGRIVGGTLTGGGWAENAAHLLNPEGTYGILLTRGTYSDGTGILGTFSTSTQLQVVSLWHWLTIVERAQDELRSRGSVVAVRLAGTPQSGWSQVQLALKVMSSVIPVPLVAPIVNAVLAVATPIVERGGQFSIDDVFNIANAFISTVRNIGGSKPLGVDSAIWGEISATVDPARRITLSAFGPNGSVGAAVRQLGAEIGAGNLTALESLARRSDVLGSQINAFYLFRRGLEAEIRKVAGTVSSITQTVTTAYNGLVSGAFDTTTNLVALGREQIDGLFGSLVTDPSKRGSATEIPLLQDIFGGVTQPELLQAIPGIHQIAGRIIGLPATFRTDVIDPATYSALAALGSGRKLASGVLDTLQFRAIIAKAEQMQREGIHFTLPPAIAEDRADCIRQEIAICVGCPPGYRSYNFGCIPEPIGKKTGADQPASTEQSASGGTTPSGGGTAASTGTPPVVTLPSCIIREGNTFWWCPPPSCSMPPSTPLSAAAPWETATIVVMNEVNSTPIEVQARRQGSAPWQDFAVRPMEPAGNSWQQGRTVFSPVAAGSPITPSFSATPGAFEAARAAQSQGMSDFHVRDPYDVLADTIPMTSAPAGSTNLGPISSAMTAIPSPPGPVPVGTLPCAVRYEARVALEPYVRWFANINGTWTEIFDCCPQRQDADACCERLLSEMGRLYLAISGGRGQDLGPITQAIAAARAEILAAIGNVSRGGTGMTYDDGPLRSAIAELKTLIEARTPAPCPTCPPADTSPLVAKLDELLMLIRSQKGTDTSVLERKVEENASLIRALIARPQPLPPIAYDDTDLKRRVDEQTRMLTELLSRNPAIVQTSAGTTVTIDYDWFRQRFNDIAAALPKCPSLNVPDYTSQFTNLTERMTRLEQLLQIRPVATIDTTDLTRRIDENASLIRTLIARPLPAGPYDDTDLKRRIDEQTRLLTLLLQKEPSAALQTSAFDYPWLRQRFDEIRAAIPQCPSFNAPDYAPQLTDMRERMSRLEQIIRTQGETLTRLEQRPLAPATQGADTTDLARRIDEATMLIRQLIARDIPSFDARPLTDELNRRISELIVLVQKQHASCPTCDTSDLQQSIDTLLGLIRDYDGRTGVRFDQLRKDIADLTLRVMTERPDIRFDDTEIRARLDRMANEFVMLRQAFTENITQCGADPALSQEVQKLRQTLEWQTMRYDEILRSLERRLQEGPSVGSPQPPMDRQPHGRPDCPDCPTTIERHEKITYGNASSAYGNMQSATPQVPQRIMMPVPVAVPVMMPRRRQSRRC